MVLITMIRKDDLAANFCASMCMRPLQKTYNSLIKQLNQRKSEIHCTLLDAFPFRRAFAGVISRCQKEKCLA